MNTPFETKLTQYGFQFGPLTLERACADRKKGWVIAIAKTARHLGGVQLYVTRTGKLRVFGEDGEWLPPRKQAKE